MHIFHCWEGLMAKENGKSNGYHGKTGVAHCPECNAEVKANPGPNGPKYAEHNCNGSKCPYSTKYVENGSFKLVDPSRGNRREVHRKNGGKSR